MLIAAGEFIFAEFTIYAQFRVNANNPNYIISSNFDLESVNIIMKLEKITVTINFTKINRAYFLLLQRNPGNRVKGFMQILNLFSIDSTRLTTTCSCFTIKHKSKVMKMVAAKDPQI